jgi:hypothetical protein
MSDAALRQAYAAHIRSSYWRWLRDIVGEFVDWRCERCGLFGRDFDLHHKTYERFGEERSGDVEYLCKGCHRVADQERRAQLPAAAWGARVDGWARAVYGDDWELGWGYEEVEERFLDWLDRRDGEDSW